MFCFKTSFLTLTLALVALLVGGFSQCCFASRAKSDPSSTTGSGAGAAFRDVDAAVFFCLFAGGMAAEQLCEGMPSLQSRRYRWSLCCPVQRVIRSVPREILN